MHVQSVSSLMLLVFFHRNFRPLKALSARHYSALEHSKPGLSLAPMMDYTDRHYRHMIRLLSRSTILYTEMVAANAIVNQHNLALEGDEIALRRMKRFIAQSTASPYEEPCVLQLGGADAELLHKAARIAHLEYGDICNYTAMNLNCGCPSSKVASSGSFGAALMHEPILVRDITTSMSEGCNHEIPITVKCRIGTDMTNPNWKNPTNKDDSKLYSQLYNFIETIASDAIVTQFQIHARIAVLNKNFSPLDNRQIPPLRYDIVSRLMKDFPELRFTLNGGVQTLTQADTHLKGMDEIDGVMIGRGFLNNPWQFAMTDSILHNDTNNNKLTRYELLQTYGKHADIEESIWGMEQTRRCILKPLFSLFHGEKHSKRFKQRLDEIAMTGSRKRRDKDVEIMPLSQLILNAATDTLSDEVLFRTAQESYYLNK